MSDGFDEQDRAAIVAAYRAAGARWPAKARGSVGCAIAVVGAVALVAGPLVLKRVAPGAGPLFGAIMVTVVVAGLGAHVVSGVRRSSALHAAREASLDALATRFATLSAEERHAHAAALLYLSWDADGPSLRRAVDPDELRRRLGEHAVWVESVDRALKEDLEGYFAVFEAGP